MSIPENDFENKRKQNGKRKRTTMDVSGVLR